MIEIKIQGDHFYISVVFPFHSLEIPDHFIKAAASLGVFVLFRMKTRMNELVISGINNLKIKKALHCKRIE